MKTYQKQAIKYRLQVVVRGKKLQLNVKMDAWDQTVEVFRYNTDVSEQNMQVSHLYLQIFRQYMEIYLVNMEVTQLIKELSWQNMQVFLQ